MNNNRVSSASLYRPAAETRTERRARRRAEQEIHRTAASAERAAGRQAERAARAAAAAGRAVPAGGYHRPAALRTFRRLRISGHRATTSTLAAAYLFQAEGGLGSDGMYIGRDAFTHGSFFFDPWVLYERGALTNPNMFLAGEIGAGKSALAKAMVCRGLVFGRKAYVPGDVKGEWTAVAEAVGGKVMRLGPGQPYRINPLDVGAPPPAGTAAATEWQRAARGRRLELMRSLAESLAQRPLQAPERAALALALDMVCERTGDPLIPQLVDQLFRPDTHAPLPAGFASYEDLRAAGVNLGHILSVFVNGELAGLFDRSSTARFDPQAPMMSLDLSRLGETNPAMPLVMTCTSAWMEAALQDPTAGQRFCVYDEAWRVMRELPLLRRMQSGWKLARAWGIANVAIVHRVSDFAAVGDAGSELRALAEGLVADTSVRIIYRQKSDQIAATAKTVGLTTAEQRLLTSLGRGAGLWRVENSPYVINHIISNSERELFNTDARMTDKHDPAAGVVGL